MTECDALWSRPEKAGLHLDFWMNDAKWTFSLLKFSALVTGIVRKNGVF
jgi:hypothetical protein